MIQEQTCHLLILLCESEYILPCVYIYANGDGIERSYSKARELLTQAAAQENEASIQNLKRLDELGFITARCMWLPSIIPSRNIQIHINKYIPSTGSS